jgi:hypothetical protein
MFSFSTSEVCGASEILLRLLREIANSLGIGEGRSDSSPSPTAINWKGDRNTAGWWLAQSLRATGCVKTQAKTSTDRNRLLAVARFQAPGVVVLDSFRRVDQEKWDWASSISSESAKSCPDKVFDRDRLHIVLLFRDGIGAVNWRGEVARTLLLFIAQRTEIIWFSFFETGIIREVQMRSMSENSGRTIESPKSSSG